MKSWHKRLLSLILALSMLLSCFTVLVFADDEGDEETEEQIKPVVAYKKTSRSAVEYTKLAKEIIDYADRKERN